MLLFGLAVIFLSFVFAGPSASAVPYATNNSQALNPDCNRLPVIIPLRRVKVRSCTRAVRSLPQHEGELLFHNGPPSDLSHLPRKVSFEDCEVVVTTSRREGAWGSWASIRGSTIEVIYGCIIKGTLNPTLSRGGYQITGHNGGIKVEVRKKGFFSEEIES